MAMTHMQSARVLSLATLAVLFTTGHAFAEIKTSGPYTGFAACQEKMNTCTDKCNDNRLSRSGDDYEACLKSCNFTYGICVNATPPDITRSGTGNKAAPSAK